MYIFFFKCFLSVNRHVMLELSTFVGGRLNRVIWNNIDTLYVISLHSLVIPSSGFFFVVVLYFPVSAILLLHCSLQNKQEVKNSIT